MALDVVGYGRLRDSKDLCKFFDYSLLYTSTIPPPQQLKELLQIYRLFTESQYLFC